MNAIFTPKDYVVYIPDGHRCEVIEVMSDDDAKVAFEDGTVETVDQEHLALHPEHFEQHIKFIFGLNESTFWGETGGKKFSAATMKDFERLGCNAIDIIKGQFNTMSTENWKLLKAAGIEDGKTFMLKCSDAAVSGLYQFNEGKFQAVIGGTDNIRPSVLLAYLKDGGKIMDAEAELAKFGFVRKKEGDVQETVNHEPPKAEEESQKQQGPKDKRDAWDKAREIFREYKEGGTLRQLAKKYDCGTTTMYRIIKQEENSLRARMKEAIAVA